MSLRTKKGIEGLATVIGVSTRDHSTCIMLTMRNNMPDKSSTMPREDIYNLSTDLIGKYRMNNDFPRSVDRAKSYVGYLKEESLIDEKTEEQYVEVISKKIESNLLSYSEKLFDWHFEKLLEVELVSQSEDEYKLTELGWKVSDAAIEANKDFLDEIGMKIEPLYSIKPTPKPTRWWTRLWEQLKTILR